MSYGTLAGKVRQAAVAKAAAEKQEPKHRLSVQWVSGRLLVHLYDHDGTITGSRIFRDMVELTGWLTGLVGLPKDIEDAPS